MTRKEIELFVEKKFSLDGEAYLRVFHDQIEDALVQIHDAALDQIKAFAKEHDEQHGEFYHGPREGCVEHLIAEIDALKIGER